MANLYEGIIFNSGLYTPDFRRKMGETSPHWSQSGWKKREAFLRHQMVCVLLCNTEEILTDDALRMKSAMRASKTTGAGSSKSTTSGATLSSGESGKSHTGSNVDLELPVIYRCQLLEGNSNITLLQNKITKERMKIDLPFKKLYDIYDQKENKLVEVKVTLSHLKEIHTFNNGPDPDHCVSLVHLNPQNPSKFHTVNLKENLPGLNKAITFLQTRYEVLKTEGLKDYEVDPELDTIKQVICDPVLRDWVSIWKDSFWAHRDNNDGEGIIKAAEKDELKPFVEGKLKLAIEDVAKRKAPYMEYNGLILPPVMKAFIETGNEKDSDMMTEVIGSMINLSPIRQEDSDIIEAVNEAMDLYKTNVIDGMHTHFQPISKKDINLAKNLKWVIGMGIKESVESHNHETLQQPTYELPPKRRYHPWMSMLLVHLTQNHERGVRFYESVLKPEYVWSNEHPMVSVADSVLEAFLAPFCDSWCSMFCSEIRNLYSRLGGAYTVMHPSKAFAQIVCFPLYSTGVFNGKRTRFVSGFIVRGEAHAKQPTDRIPLLTVEFCDEFNDGAKYLKFVKKAKWARCPDGRLVCVRQNSIMKSDPTFLAYVHNSLYLSANMMGDLLLKSVPSPNSDLKLLGVTFMAQHREWILERVSEGIIMALLGGSQEEGAMAIIRKIFMNKMVWMRRKPVFGWDENGLASALNECLFDHPFALYLAHQMREILTEEMILPIL